MCGEIVLVFVADARCDLEGTLWLCCGSQDGVQLCCSIVSVVKNKKYLETVKLVMIFLLVSDVVYRDGNSF